MCKRFDLEPAKWAIAKVVAALAVCLAAYSATVPAVTGAMQKDASSPNSGQPSSAPVITATPDRVTVSGGHGSTDIRWDRGDGSVGFVFVTENARKAVLFATGHPGSMIHVDIIGGKVWVQYDGTSRPVAEELAAAGIPREEIVLAFHPADVRRHTAYAVG